MEALPCDVLRLLGSLLGTAPLLRLCLTCRALLQALPPLFPAPCVLLGGDEAGEAAPVLLLQGRRFTGLRALRLEEVPCPGPALRAAAALPQLVALHLTSGCALTPGAADALCALPRLEALVLEGGVDLPARCAAPRWARTLRTLRMRAPLPQGWWEAMAAGAFPALTAFAGTLHDAAFPALAACPLLTSLALHRVRLCYLRAHQPAWRALLQRCTALRLEDCQFATRPHLHSTIEEPLLDALRLCAPRLQALAICSTARPQWNGGYGGHLAEHAMPLDAAWLMGLALVWPRGLTQLELTPVALCPRFCDLLAELSPTLHTLQLTATAAAGGGYGLEALCQRLPLLRSLALHLHGSAGRGARGVEAVLTCLAQQPHWNLASLSLYGQGGAPLSPAAAHALRCLPARCSRLRHVHVPHLGLRTFPRSSSPPPPPLPAAGAPADGASAAPAPAAPCARACGAMVVARLDAADHDSHCPQRPRHCLLGCGALLPTASAAAEHALCSSSSSSSSSSAHGACPMAHFQVPGSHPRLRFPTPAALTHSLQRAVQEGEALALGLSTQHCPMRWRGCTFSAAAAEAAAAAAAALPHAPPPTLGVLVTAHLLSGRCAFAEYVCLGCGQDVGKERGVAKCHREGCSASAARRCAMPHVEGERREAAAAAAAAAAIG